MDAKPRIVQSKVPFLENFPRGYVFIDIWGSSEASFDPWLIVPSEFPEIPDDLKLLGLDALDHAVEFDVVAGSVEMHAEGSTVADDALEEDADMMSDDETYDLWESEIADEPEFDAAFSEEGVKRKLEVLASMVGIQCLDPTLVLGEVVRVLKELDQNIGIRCHNMVLRLYWKSCITGLF